MRAFDWLNVKLGVRSQVGLAFTMAVVLILVGMVVFKRMEDWTWTESFYYAVITLSTVGYGDLTPTRPATQVAAAFYILIGVTLFVSAIGIIGMNYIETRQRAVLRSMEERQTDLEARIAILERMEGITRGKLGSVIRTKGTDGETEGGEGPPEGPG